MRAARRHFVCAGLGPPALPEHNVSNGESNTGRHELCSRQKIFSFFHPREEARNGYASALRGKCKTGQARSGRDSQYVQFRRFSVRVPLLAPHLHRVVSLGGPCTNVQTVAQWSEERMQRAR